MEKNQISVVGVLHAILVKYMERRGVVSDGQSTAYRSYDERVMAPDELLVNFDPNIESPKAKLRGNR
uniref:Uncharacterized protein n=1 Tax=Helianthus annuus TaxID=4232 RepID=A0A251VNV9_HELAN